MMWPPSGFTLHYCTWAGSFLDSRMFLKLLNDINVYMLCCGPMFRTHYMSFWRITAPLIHRPHFLNNISFLITAHKQSLIHTTGSLFIWAIDAVFLPVTDKSQRDAFTACHTLKLLRGTWWRCCHKEQNNRRVYTYIIVALCSDLVLCCFFAAKFYFPILWHRHSHMSVWWIYKTTGFLYRFCLILSVFSDWL